MEEAARRAKADVRAEARMAEAVAREEAEEKKRTARKSSPPGSPGTFEAYAHHRGRLLSPRGPSQKKRKMTTGSMQSSKKAKGSNWRSGHTGSGGVISPEDFEW